MSYFDELVDSYMVSVDEPKESDVPAWARTEYMPTFQQPVQPELEEEQRDSAWDALKGGFSSTGQSLGATFDTYTGDNQGVVDSASIAPDITIQQQAFQDTLRKYQEAGDETLWQGVKNVFASAWDNPTGAFHEMVAQLPNSGVVIGSMIAGAKAGGAGGAALGSVAPGAGTAAGGLIGSIAGGITGMFVGNNAIETGAIAQDKARDGDFTEAERQEVIRQGAIKSGVITGIDTLTMGTSRAVLGIPGRAVERAIKNTLIDEGVDVAQDAAVKSALSNKVIRDKVVLASKNAFEQTTKTPARIGMGATAFAGETFGEGAGEYFGSMAAGLDTSFTDAALESMLGMPQSLTEMRVAKEITSPGRLTDLTAKTPLEDNLDQIQGNAPEKTLDETIEQGNAQLQDAFNQGAFDQNLVGGGLLSAANPIRSELSIDQIRDLSAAQLPDIAPLEGELLGPQGTISQDRPRLEGRVIEGRQGEAEISQQFRLGRDKYIDDSGNIVPELPAGNAGKVGNELVSEEDRIRRLKALDAPSQGVTRINDRKRYKEKEPEIIEGEFEEIAGDETGESVVKDRQVVRVPLNELSLSKDVPQFKSDANEKGIVDPIEGDYDELGMGPIQVWVRNDGRKEVISGRHRFEKAKESGEKDIPAQYHYEKDGFDAKRAKALDAELNIKEGQGQVIDYVDVIRDTGITEEEAKRKGYFRNKRNQPSIGRRAFDVANAGSDALIASLRNRQITSQAAQQIALTAPNNEAFQALGIQAFQENGKDAKVAVNIMKAAQSMPDTGMSQDGDLFGFDDSAMKQAKAMAKIAIKKQKDIRDEINTVKGAANKPKIAAKYNVKVGDAKGLQKKIEQMKAEAARYDNWHMHSDLLEEIRQEAAPEQRNSETFDLESQTEESLAQQEAEIEAKNKEESEAKAQEEQRFDADANIDGFMLTGSDSQADVAMAAGQTDIFFDTPKEPETTQPPISETPVETEITGGENNLRAISVGDKLSSGEIVLTTSGNKTTPFPKVSTGTNRKAANTDKNVNKWLIDNAVNEARAIGDEFNLIQFESMAENYKNLSQADKDSAAAYLFDKDFLSVKKPNGSILKPLTTQDTPVETEITQKDNLETEITGGEVKPINKPSPRQKRIIDLIGNVGDTVTPSQDVDYLKKGESVTIKDISKNGEVQFASDKGETNVQYGILNGAVKGGVKFDKQDAKESQEPSVIADQKPGEVSDKPTVRENIKLNPIKTKSGKPFKTSKSANTAASLKEKSGELEPGWTTAFEDGGWVIYPSTNQVNEQSASYNLSNKSRVNNLLDSINDISVKEGNAIYAANVTGLDKTIEAFNFGPKEKTAFLRFLKGRKDSKEILNRLENLSDTPWAKQAIMGALSRLAINDLVAGQEVDYDSPLMRKAGKGIVEAIRKNGKEGIWDYLTAKDFIGHPEKPVNAVNGSFIDCDPSRQCAKYCYATKGHYNYATSINKSELIAWAVEADPERAAEKVFREYHATTEYEAKKALRLFDKGDGSMKWLPFIEALNKKRVRTQIFTKDPQFAEAVSDFNLVMLSIDESNLNKAFEHPNLKVALVYNGSKKLTDWALKNAKRISVILPVKQGQRTLDKNELSELKKNKETRKRLCPIDSGTKKLGDWTCINCDKNGGIGCFHGDVTSGILKAAQTRNLEIDQLKVLQDEISELSKELDRESRDELIRSLGKVLSEARRGVDSRATEEGERAFYEASERTRGGGGETVNEREADGLQSREPDEDWVVGRTLDLFSDANLSNEDKKQAYRDIFYTKSENRKTGSIKVGVDTVTSPEHAAHVLESYSEDTQETFVILVTDKNKKILQVIRHTKGLRDRSHIDPAVIIGSVLDVPGAKNVWLSHNHPSGESSPSDSDYTATDTIVSQLKDTGVNYEGHVVLGDGNATFFTDYNYGSVDVDILPIERTRDIPVTERKFTTRTNQEKITSPADAKKHADRVESDRAILLVDQRGKVGAVIPVNEKMLNGLRETGENNRLFKAIVNANPAGAVLKDYTQTPKSRKAMQNISGFFNENRITVYDMLHSTALGDIRSAAEKGDALLSEKGYYSLSTNAKGISQSRVKLATNKLSKDTGVDIEVVETAENLPEGLYSQVKKDGVESRVRGLYDNETGKAYIVASNLNSPKEAVEVFLHEVIGHKGIRATLGNKLNVVLSQIHKSMPGDIKAELQAEYAGQLQDKSQVEQNRIIADEYVALLAQTDPKNSLLDRVVSVIRNWLRKFNPNMEWTRNDLVELLAQSKRSLKNPKSSKTSGARSSLESDAYSYAEGMWKILSNQDELFQYEISESKDMVEIGKDHGLKIEKKDVAEVKDYVTEVAERQGIKVSEYWQVGKAQIYGDGQNVWLDVSDLEPGKDRGSNIYSTVFDFAFNNGRKFIGDPAGQFPRGAIRRTEMMISAALKYGTTEHMGPGLHQKNPELTWIKPLEWKEGNNSFNLKSLLEVAYSNITHIYPELKDMYYDFDTGRFTTTRTDDFSKGLLEQIQSGERFVPDKRRVKDSSDPTTAGAEVFGGSSIKRAILTNTALSEKNPAQRGRILSQVSKYLYTTIPSEIKNILYSKNLDMSKEARMKRARETLDKKTKFIYSKVDTLFDDGNFDRSTYNSLSDEFEDSITDEEYDAIENGEWVDSVEIPLSDSDKRKIISHLNSITWYHGSPFSSIKLDVTKTGANDTLYISADKDVAEDHTERHSGEDGRIYELGISIKNPLFVETSDISTDLGYSSTADMLRKNGYDSVIALDYGEAVILSNDIIKLGNESDSSNLLYSLKSDALSKFGLNPKAKKGLLAKLHEWATKENEDSVWEYFKSRAHEGIFDGLYGIKKAEDRSGVSPENSSYIGARLATGVADTMNAILHFGAPEWQNGIIQKKAGTEGLLKVLEPVAKDLPEFLGWVAAHRSEELMALGKENNVTQEEIDELKNVTPEQLKRFETAHKKYAEMNKAMLDLAEEAGLINSESRAEWESEWYIPFYREAEEDGDLLGPRTSKGLSHQSSGIKKLKGGEMPTEDLLENILSNWLKLTDASMKNSALVKTVDNLKDTDYIDREPMAWAAAMIPKGQIYDVIREDARFAPARAALNNAFGDVELAILTMQEEGNASTVDLLSEAVEMFIDQQSTGGLEKMWSMVAPTRPDVIRIKRNGKSEFYKVNDPSLLRATTHLNFGGFQDPITKVGRKLKRLLTTGVTASPDFMLRNLIRDSAHAWAINPDGFKFGRDTYKGMKKAFEEDSDYVSMMFMGASFQGGYVHGTDPEASADIIKRALEKKGLSPHQIRAYQNSRLDTFYKMKDALSGGWQKYRTVGDKIENANRLATFKAAIANSKTLRQAGFEAKDLMDYSLRGNFITLQYLTDLVPFMNARLQGMNKLIRAGRDNPKLFLNAGFKIAMVSTAIALWNLDNDEYEELPDWDKDANWHIWLGDEHFRIPKPFEIGILFGTMPERATHAMFGNQDAKDFTWSVRHNLMETMALNPTPQFAMPIIESVANRQFFFDRPIEGMADEGKITQARYDERTSETARILSDVMSFLPDSLELSPKKIEHLINGYTGTLGMYALGVADVASSAFIGKPDAPSMNLEDMPIVKVLYRGTQNKSTQFATDVYDRLREVDQIARTINAYREEELKEEAQQLFEDNREKLRYRRALGKARKQFGQIRKEMNKIERHKFMTPEVKRKKLDELTDRRNRLARKYAELTEEAF